MCDQLKGFDQESILNENHFVRFWKVIFSGINAENMNMLIGIRDLIESLATASWRIASN